MRTRPPSHKPAGLDLEFTPFDADILDSIIATTLQDRTSVKTIPTADILERLNKAAIAHKFERDYAKSPTAKMERDAVSKLRKAAQALHNLLPVEYDEDALSGDQCNPHVADGISRLVDTSMRTLMLQRLEAANAEQNARMTADELFKSNSPDDALLLLSDLSGLLAESIDRLGLSGTDKTPEYTHQNANRNFVRALLGVYKDISPRPIGISKSSITNAPQGPLIRFLRACFNQIPEEDPSDDSLVRWVQHSRQEASKA